MMYGIHVFSFSFLNILFMDITLKSDFITDSVFIYFFIFRQKHETLKPKILVSQNIYMYHN